MKNRIKLILSILFILSLLVLLISCGDDKCKSHVDIDKNAKCDTCGERVECTSHVDVDKNLKCDVCGDAVPCTHSYTNACDAVCNICSATRVPSEHICDNLLSSIGLVECTCKTDCPCSRPTYIMRPILFTEVIKLTHPLTLCFVLVILDCI